MDDGLKQRLIGAVVLIAVAVIFVPTFLDSGGRRAIDLATKVPPEPVVIAEPLELPPPAPPQVVRPAKPLDENYAHPEAELEADITPADTSTKSLADRVPQRAPDISSSGVPTGWSIQVASFADGKRADAFLQLVRDKGFARSYVRQGDVAGKPVYRVFVGPKLSKEKALEEQATLERELKVDSLLVKFAP
ncbi:SPOR domain-containing protein [Aurantivibrio plasticivorans]